VLLDTFGLELLWLYWLYAFSVARFNLVLFLSVAIVVILTKLERIECSCESLGWNKIRSNMSMIVDCVRLEGCSKSLVN